ncbi:MAG: SEC-C metal-binding domain-containing protein [Anaerolineae bacterium]
MDKVGRNDPCPCGSGKKFKKCCEEKVKHKKIEAQLLSDTAEKEVLTQAKKLTNFFQRNVAPPPPPVQTPQENPPESFNKDM